MIMSLRKQYGYKASVMVTYVPKMDEGWEPVLFRIEELARAGLSKSMLLAHFSGLVDGSAPKA